MGEIADDCIDGSCCQLCLRYFKDSSKKDKSVIYTHGYPVACKECWKELTKVERKQYQLAIEDLF